MSGKSPGSLLAEHDPPPARLANPGAERAIVIVCEHASKGLPASLSYPQHVLDAHFGSDIGSAKLASELGDRLGARVVLANYSRLVVDCNRRLGDPTFVLPVAEGERLEANSGLDAQALAQRVEQIYAPFHACVEAQLQQIHALGTRPLYVAIHSFTPQLNGESRPWDVGIMWDKDPLFAAATIADLKRDPSICVGDNQPYSGQHVADFSVDYHAERQGFSNLAIEVRQDNLLDEGEISMWARRLGDAITRVLELPQFSQSVESNAQPPAFYSDPAEFLAHVNAWNHGHECN